jgi:hypothetical protein
MTSGPSSAASRTVGVDLPEFGLGALAARDHPVRAERLDQLDLGRCRVADHGQPLVPAELDRELADDARRPGHREGRAGRQRQQVERVPQGQPVHRQRRRLFQGPPVGDAGQRVLGHGDVFGLRAAARHRRGDRRHHSVAGPPAGAVRPGDIEADGVDHAGQVHARDERRLEPGRQRPAAGPEAEVGRVHRGRRDLDQDLPGPGGGLGHGDDVQHRRVAELGEANRSHHLGHDVPPVSCLAWAACLPGTTRYPGCRALPSRLRKAPQVQPVRAG